MNGIIRNALRVSAVRNLFSSVSNAGATNNQLRTLWNVYSRQIEVVSAVSTKKFKHQNSFCNCGCSRGAHTKGIFTVAYFYSYYLFEVYGRRKINILSRADI